MAVITGIIIYRTDKVNKIDPWPGDTTSYFVATSDRLSSYPANKLKMEEPQTAVLHLLVAY